jgi:hypothetical protein
MAKYETRSINSLLTCDSVSSDSDFDLNKLRAVFDNNYLLWKSLPTGDPHRLFLRNENEKIINLILDRG